MVGWVEKTGVFHSSWGEVRRGGGERRREGGRGEERGGRVRRWKMWRRRRRRWKMW